MPLPEGTRTTDSLAPENAHHHSPDTSRVVPLEFDTVLQPGVTADRQRQQPQPSQQKFDPYATVMDTPGRESVRDGGGDTHSAAAATGELHTPSSSSPLPPPASPPADDDFDITRPANAAEFDEEVTIMSRRVSRLFEAGQQTPARVQPIPSAGHAAAASAAGQGAQGSAASAQAPAATPRKRSLWPVVLIVCGGLLLVAVAGALLAVRYLIRPGQTDVSVVPATEPLADAKALAKERLNEAESLLAAGDLAGAIERLREAVRLDPTNARAHRRLGDVLLDAGDRRAAIEELRAATQFEPNDFTTWRALAAAQLAEGLPADAVESYKRLLALTGEADPNDQLSYADSLRLAGRADDARALYQKLSASQSAEVAAAARQHLAAFASAEASPTAQPTREARPGQEETEIASTANANANVATVPTQTTPTPAPQSTPTPRPADASPADRYQRGVELWSSNRGAAVTEFMAAARGGSADANYYLGLSLVEGKDMGNLKRAEIVAALGYFQRAQSGSHGAQARRYVQQLEREFDRIRQQ